MAGNTAQGGPGLAPPPASYQDGHGPPGQPSYPPGAPGAASVAPAAAAALPPHASYPHGQAGPAVNGQRFSSKYSEASANIAQGTGIRLPTLQDPSPAPVLEVRPLVQLLDMSTALIPMQNHPPTNQDLRPRHPPTVLVTRKTLATS